MSQENSDKRPADEDVNPAAKKTKLADEDEADNHAVKKETLSVKDVLEKIRASEQAVLVHKSAEKPIRKHEFVVIDFTNESGLPEAMIKQAPLSESERKLCEWMKSHQHDRFQNMVQVSFYDTLCMDKMNHTDEDREDYLKLMKKEVKEYVDEYNNKDKITIVDAKELPFTAEELVQVMYDIAIGSKQWVRCTETDEINRFKTEEGALCMTMSGWC